MYVQNIYPRQQVEITNINKFSFPVFISYFMEYYKNYKNFDLKQYQDILKILVM